MKVPVIRHFIFLAMSLVSCALLDVPNAIAVTSELGRNVLDAPALDDVDGSSKPVLNVKDFAAKGDGKVDDSTAFSSALKILATQGGTLLIPSGSYLVGDLKVESDITIKGTGVPRPVLIKTQTGKTILDLTGDVIAGQRHGIHDVTIESLALRGRSVEDGFKEHVHNVSVLGATKLLVHDVVFEAFQGDGLYLGSRLSSSEAPAHNSDIIVANSEFRGVNSQNRNGISIIDCSHCIIESNSFSDLTRPAMPGPIDIEPNELNDVVQNIILRHNVIKGTNGVGGISIALRAGDFLESLGPILIEKNYIDGAKIGLDIIKSHGTNSETATPLGLTIRRNTVTGSDRPLWMDGISDAVVEQNEFSDSPVAIGIGCSVLSKIRFQHNTITRVGSKSDTGVYLCGNLTSIVFNGNKFIDTGSVAQGSSAVLFTKATVDGVNFLRNTFSSPHHLTHFAVYSTASAVLHGATPNWVGNILNDNVQLGDFPKRKN